MATTTQDEKKRKQPRKAAPSKTTKKTSKPVSKSKNKPDNAQSLSPQELHEKISVAAYFIAEKRGFQGGNPEDDWYEAEMLVTREYQSIH